MSKQKAGEPAQRAVAVVDLFCGAGGLTRGLLNAGLRVVAGVDTDEACRFPYERNNPGARFLNSDIATIPSESIAALYPAGSLRVLVGCAPCQPFSTYSRRHEHAGAEKWPLLRSFSRLAVDLRPVIVSMENVPQLTRHEAYAAFVKALSGAGYNVAEPHIAYGPDYGLPQERSRLIFFASLLGPMKFVSPTHKRDSYRTLADAIKNLEAINAGGASRKDPLHKSCTLSSRNLQRIKAASPGGTWREWPAHLLAECHRKESGETYPSVYGRMEWDKPAPTITTQFYGFGNGRFGHPEQDRALSLREGAILQDFPQTYEFVPRGKPVCFRSVGRMIGNAVPVSLATAVGATITQHLAAQGSLP